MSKQVDPFYISKEWKRTRLKVLQRDKWVCEECKVRCLGRAKGKPSPHVDHKQPLKQRPDLALDMDNLRTLCHSCHSKHTKLTESGNKKQEIGLDGYPVDNHSQ